ncbi:MAG: hypothetical protein ABSG25_03775 [Bryobacteraceae bacterium]
MPNILGGCEQCPATSNIDQMTLLCNDCYRYLCEKVDKVKKLEKQIEKLKLENKQLKEEIKEYNRE